MAKFITYTAEDGTTAEVYPCYSHVLTKGDPREGWTDDQILDAVMKNDIPTTAKDIKVVEDGL